MVDLGVCACFKTALWQDSALANLVASLLGQRLPQRIGVVQPAASALDLPRQRSHQTRNTPTNMQADKVGLKSEVPPRGHGLRIQRTRTWRARCCQVGMWPTGPPGRGSSVCTKSNRPQSHSLTPFPHSNITPTSLGTCAWMQLASHHARPRCSLYRPHGLEFRHEA